MKVIQKIQLLNSNLA